MHCNIQLVYFTVGIILLISFTHKSTAESQYINAVYDVLTDLSCINNFTVDTSSPSPSVSKCAFKCQLRQGCYIFAICATAMTPKCVTLKAVDNANTTNLIVNSLYCRIYGDSKKLLSTSCTDTSQPPSLNINNGTLLSDLVKVWDNGSPNIAMHDGVTDFFGCYSHSRVDDSKIYQCRIYESAGREIELFIYQGKVVLQIRLSQGCDFNKSFNEYYHGFGSIQSGCYWMGNYDVWYITNQVQIFWKLWIALHNETGNGKVEISYDSFSIETDSNRFRLRYTKSLLSSIQTTSSSSKDNVLDGFSGSGDSDDVNGKYFYAYDFGYGGNICAIRDGGAWWFNSKCSYGNLNHAGAPVWPDQNGDVVPYDKSFMGIEPNAYDAFNRDEFQDSYEADD